MQTTHRSPAPWQPSGRRPATWAMGAVGVLLAAVVAGCTATPVAVTPPAVTALPTETRVVAARPSPTVVGEVGRVVIPAAGIDVALVEVSWRLDEQEGQTVAVWETAEGAAGHHTGTAAPGGAGNCVISGHSGAAEGVTARLEMPGEDE